MIKFYVYRYHGQTYFGRSYITEVGLYAFKASFRIGFGDCEISMSNTLLFDDGGIDVIDNLAREMLTTEDCKEWIDSHPEYFI